MGSALLVESNEHFYCPEHIGNKITHQTDNMLEKECNDDVKQRANRVKIKTFDEKAKQIDKYALVIMPILFIITSAFYWTAHLRKG